MPAGKICSIPPRETLITYTNPCRIQMMENRSGQMQNLEVLILDQSRASGDIR